MKTKIIFLFVTLLSAAMIASCNLPWLIAKPTPTSSSTSTPSIKNTATIQTTISKEAPSPTVTTTYIAGDLGWGSIHGRVTDAGAGAPIVGAKVTCWHYSYTSPARCNASILTNQDGEFVFTDIYFHDTDHIQVNVDAIGYTTQTIDARFFTWPSLTADFALVPTVSVEPPSAVCTRPACRPYEALTCPQGNCTGGCGYICATPAAICTPPACAIGTSEVYYCSSGACAGGCGTTCATFTPGP